MLKNKDSTNASFVFVTILLYTLHDDALYFSVQDDTDSYSYSCVQLILFLFKHILSKCD